MGRLVPEKGVDLLIQAFSTVLKSYGKLKLEIAGDGPELTRLQKLTEQLDLSANVTFLGLRHNYTVLKKWQLLVNPLIAFAPLEMVNVEAAYMGVPVICFGDQYVPETVIDEKTGIKITEVSTEELSRVMLELIENPRKTEVMSKNARIFAKDNFNFQSQSNKLKKGYLNLGLLS